MTWHSDLSCRCDRHFCEPSVPWRPSSAPSTRSHPFPLARPEEATLRRNRGRISTLRRHVAQWPVRGGTSKRAVQSASSREAGFRYATVLALTCGTALLLARCVAASTRFHHVMKVAAQCRAAASGKTYNLVVWVHRARSAKYQSVALECLQPSIGGARGDCRNLAYS